MNCAVGHIGDTEIAFFLRDLDGGGAERERGELAGSPPFLALSARRRPKQRAHTMSDLPSSAASRMNASLPQSVQVPGAFIRSPFEGCEREAQFPGQTTVRSTPFRRAFGHTSRLDRGSLQVEHMF